MKISRIFCRKIKLTSKTLLKGFQMFVIFSKMNLIVKMLFVIPTETQHLRTRLLHPHQEYTIIQTLTMVVAKLPLIKLSTNL